MSHFRDNSDEVDEVNYKTLSRFVMANTADQELTILMNAIAVACKATARACRKAGIANLFGMAGEQNSSGDDQKKLDVLSNDIFVNSLVNCHACAVLVSEENEEPIIVPAAMQGKYCVAFDPLDGSSNIDCNVSTGTIFGVYEKTIPGPGTVADILRKGQDLVVAGYCMYGAATELVICFQGRGVHRFALDPSIGEFIHTHANVKFPVDGGKKIYSCNEGNANLWDESCKEAVDFFKSGDKPYAMRYVGSMVSDVHRTLLYGGIFIYPADKKSKDGKLRVLYEGFPMAMIVEAAGGVASTGMFKGKIQRLMDIEPQNVHERCPVILGSPRDVAICLSYYEKAAKTA
ncbi:cytosolic fructose-1,6-bisphosphatase [Pavlovales sp. CCMP2436]|nr:cytosolic fructose-1,6-bisphosphatase [Pavlovales sp. CCMP2436]